MKNMSTIMHGERQLPSVYFREEDLPELAGWSVGGKYYLVIGVEMTGKNAAMVGDGNDQKKLEGSFKILTVEKMKQSPQEQRTRERRAFERASAQAKSY